jgi:hypothetical protein
MLIDQLLSHPLLDRAGFWTPDLRGRLSKAPKFMLARDFAVAADEFSTSNIDALSTVLPLARLPYPEIWLEVAQQDRRSFAAAPLQANDGKLARVGWLLTQTAQSGAWSAQMFWSFALSERLLGRLLPPTTSPLLLTIDPLQSDAANATAFRQADNLGPMFDHDYARRLANAEDWIGEPGFLIATLALLNSRNASETELTEPNNKRRRLTGKPLLFSYHLVRIPQRYQHRHLAAGAAADPKQIRAHFCRGHFKARRTGIFFWSAHQRGDAKLGFVHKDYLLTRPAA